MHRLRYASPTGEAVELDSLSVSVGTANDMRASEWAYKMASSGAITGLHRQAQAVKATLSAGDLAEADRLCSLFDGDVASYKDRGAAYLDSDGWRQSALVVHVNPSKVTPFGVVLTLTVLLLDGVWRRVTAVHFKPGSADGESTTGLDFPTDFQFDYAGTSRSSQVSSVSSGGCLARLTFFGPCSNPYCRIGRNVYRVNASADAGERIVIDPTRRRTLGGSVYRVGLFGERTNLYGSRGRGAQGSGSYVFEQLPAGRLDVSWPQSYGVDVELIEERGVLPWS